MKKSKLFDVFGRLSAWEHRHLKQFLESPFFNQRKDVIALFDFMLLEEKKEGAKFDRKEAYQRVYKTTTFDDDKMRMLMSRLFRLVEHFLAIRKVEEKEALMKLTLAQAYRDMRQEKSFKKSIKDIERILEKKPYRNADYLRQQFEVEFEYYDYIESQNRLSETNLQHLSDTFDHFYLAAKLKQVCLALSHQAVVKKTYNLGLFIPVIKYIEEHPDYLNFSAISIYYYTYKAITEADDEMYFQILRQLIQEHKEEFKEREIRDIYLMAINYCIRRLNTGAPHYVSESFELYRAGLEQGYLLENGMISQFTYNNTVSAGLKLGKGAWVEKFIHEYRTKLSPRNRQSTFLFNLAKVQYAKRDFTAAMKTINLFESNDHLMTLGAKKMLLKMYYEADEYDALDSLLESLRVFLRRKEVLSYHKSYFSSIVTLTKKLMDLAPYDKKGRTKLEKQVIEAKLQSDEEWFLEQIINK